MMVFLVILLGLFLVYVGLIPAVRYLFYTPYDRRHPRYTPPASADEPPEHSETEAEPLIDAAPTSPSRRVPLTLEEIIEIVNKIEFKDYE